MAKFLQQYSEKFVSKWLILLLDLGIVGIAFFIAAFFRYNFSLTYFNPDLFKYHLFVVLCIKLCAFFLFQSYTGIIRHTSMADTILITKANILGTFLIMLSNFFLLSAIASTIPYSIIGIEFFISSVLLVGSRLLIKGAYEYIANTSKQHKKLIIYGAGYLGLITKNTLLKDRKKKYEILCFIDDNPEKIGKTIEGIKVLSLQTATNKYFDIEDKDEIEVIFAIQNLPSPKRTEIAEKLLEYGIIIKVVPPIKKWLNGELNLKQINNIKIEDLLEREQIVINNKFVASFVENKTVLVTGAAGSIGSEIVRQLVSFKPKKIILIDQAESALYDLETELTRTNTENINIEFEIEVLNITNKKVLKTLFLKQKPEVVFHAAAYKHVPLMEKNPYKAIKNNVLGTQVVADLSSEFEVEKFVMISTDKAVNPTNVMGATKRLAEMYVQSLNGYHQNQTRFIITRFGNVLGSNGSVIPLFKKQIETGGPITVTDPNIIRYFMTIPEACQLVLEAGTMGKGGEVFVFDMGEPVKIIDLAHKMIKLSGLELGKDIDISFTGLRPGEKLYEELLNDNENVMPTYHSKIMIAKIFPEDHEELVSKINHLAITIEKQNNQDIVQELKYLVPEYTSTTYLSVYFNLNDTFVILGHEIPNFNP